MTVPPEKRGPGSEGRPAAPGKEGQGPGKPKVLRAAPLKDATPARPAPPVAAKAAVKAAQPAAGKGASQAAPARKPAAPAAAPARAGGRTDKTARPAWLRAAMYGGGIVLVAALVGVWVWASREARTVSIKPIGPQQIKQQATLRVSPKTVCQGVTEQELEFRLEQPPPGATINAKNGLFSWTPSADVKPGDYAITIRVSAGNEKVSHQQRFTVSVQEVPRPPLIAPIENQTVQEGQPLRLKIQATDPSPSPGPIRYTLTCNDLVRAHIDAETGAIEWTPNGREAGQTYHFVAKASKQDGTAATQKFEIRVEKALAPAVAQSSAAPPEAASAAEPGKAPSLAEAIASQQAVAPADDAPGAGDKPAPGNKPDPGDKSGRKAKPNAKGPRGKGAKSSAPQPAPVDDGPLLVLFDTKKMLVASEYHKLRKLCADRFEKQYEAQIRQGLGDAYEELAGWLAKHEDIKEDLYTALDPQHDDLPAALGLFRDLVKQFPDKIAAYANLAIAVAVTWDKPRPGVYDYTGHQKRTKSTMPEGSLGAIENFKYLIDTEKLMQGRIQFLPWEFLVLVIDHRTPLAERQWAMSNYLAKRAMFGKCYKDVPYDMEMLHSHDQVTRIMNKPYTLPNLRQFGGVCSMQADFSARVGKSLGVPAAYVGGEGNTGIGHAWVMWVELQGVNRAGIQFSLASEGRYFYDHYYVGHLHDPHTGEKITDRQLELRLHAVGMGPEAKRQAALAMEVYPVLCEKKPLDVGEQLVFLNQVTRLSPGNESAWTAIAKISKEGGITKQRYKQMMLTMEDLFRTFAAFPDFTWEVFDDLITFQETAKRKAKFFERLVAMYEQAGRPDLASQARLKLTDYLLEDKRTSEAIEGLAVAIKKFAAEGQYVPKLLDKLEAVCQQAQDKDEQLILFYKQFLPLIPTQRGDEVSPYCMAMYRRGIERFKKAGQVTLAQALEVKLAQLTAKSK